MNNKFASILILLTCFSCTENKSVELQSDTFNDAVIQLEIDKSVVEAIPSITNNDSAITHIEQIVTSNISEEIILDEIINDLIEPNTIHNYTDYNAFLKDHVSSSGKVNYSKIKQNINQLEDILSFFESTPPTSSWTYNEKLSYWINSYNAYTLYFVSQKYPVKSIVDINAKPWDVKFIPTKNGAISLNDIEHKKIRAQFNEPRIHFALNCASESCPQLLNKAFTSSTLQALLKKQTMQFLNDGSKNNLSDTSKIAISSIFDWYEDDFTKNGQNVMRFIQQYRPSISIDAQIQFMEYSWKLND